MCGRYTMTLNAEQAQSGYDLQSLPADWQPRYNVAPSQPVAVVTDAAMREAEWMRWGLIPSWAKDMLIGNRLINARAETLLEKPSFRAGVQKRRCLVLADGFYEWRKAAGKGGAAQPYYFRREDGAPFAFAGLWEVWRAPEGEEVRSCTIITCAANALVADVHERMPVMLSGDAMWDWLASGPAEQKMRLLQPYAPSAMTRFAVSALVNRPEVDRPELLLAM